MILIRRVFLLFLLVLACTAVLVLGIRSFLLFSGSSESSLEEMKLRSEGILFLSITFSAIILLIFGLTLLRSWNIFRELDKIIDLTRHGSVSMEESLMRIGALGDKIRSLNQQLSETNEMKTLRISSLVGINAFLLNNINLPLLTTDITGKVTGASPKLLEKLKADHSAVIGKNIKTALPELDFQQVISTLEIKRSKLFLDENKAAATFVPVFNRRRDLSDIICILGQEDIIADNRQAVNGRTKAEARTSNPIRRYLKARKGR